MEEQSSEVRVFRSRREKLTKPVVEGAPLGAKPYEIRDTLLTGLLLRIQPSGVKTYYLTYVLKSGKRGRVKLGRAPGITVAQARELAKDQLADVTKDIDPQEKKREARRERNAHTLRSYLNQEYGPWVLAHRPRSGAGTKKRIEVCFADLLDKKLTDLHSFHVERWRTGRLRDGIKPGTVNRDLTALRAALSKAVEWGLLVAHPLAGLKPSRVDHSPKVRYLSAEEEAGLRQALDAREARLREERASANAWRRQRGYGEKTDLTAAAFADYLKPMVIVSLNTGLRRGELLGLRWGSVDLLRKLLTVEGHSAKSGRTRHVPLNAEALDALTRWQEQNGGDGLVFEGRDGKAFYSVKKAWGAVLTTAEITNFRWHDMRHHFASWLVMRGVDLNTVRELLGHSDIKMTLRYAHLAPEHKAAAVAVLDTRDGSKLRAVK